MNFSCAKSHVKKSLIFILHVYHHYELSLTTYNSNV